MFLHIITVFPIQPELPVPRFRRREREKAGTRGTKILAGMRAASLGLGGLLAFTSQYEPCLLRTQ